MNVTYWYSIEKCSFQKNVKTDQERLEPPLICRNERETISAGSLTSLISYYHWTLDTTTGHWTPADKRFVYIDYYCTNVLIQLGAPRC